MPRAASTPKHFPKSLATSSTLWMTVLASFVCLASMSFWRRLRGNEPGCGLPPDYGVATARILFRVGKRGGRLLRAEVIP